MGVQMVTDVQGRMREAVPLEDNSFLTERSSVLLWNDTQAFPTSLFCQSYTGLRLYGAKRHSPEPAWAPYFKCSRAGISRAEVLVWPVRRERKTSVKIGGTSGFGFFPRIPQLPIISFWVSPGWEKNSFLRSFAWKAVLSSTPGTPRFPGASRERSQQSREARLAGFDPYGFRKMPFST